MLPLLAFWLNVCCRVTGNRRLCSESNVSLFVTTEPCLVVSSLHSKSDKTAPKSSHFGHGFYFHEVFDKLAFIALESPAPHRGLPLAEASALRSYTPAASPWWDGGVMRFPSAAFLFPTTITIDTRSSQIVPSGDSDVCVGAGGGHHCCHRWPSLYTRFSSRRLETWRSNVQTEVLQSS